MAESTTITGTQTYTAYFKKDLNIPGVGNLKKGDSAECVINNSYLKIDLCNQNCISTAYVAIGGLIAAGVIVLG